MRTKLTELGVARLKPPKSGRLEIWDTTLPAFGVRITENGARSWIVALRKPGAKHPSRIKLGEPGRMALADARGRARALMADPSALKPQDPPKVDTVAVVVAEFIERYQKPRNRAWREVERVLARELTPWSDRPIQSITRRDVIELLDGIADRGAPYMANRTLAHVRKLFGWAMDREIVTGSPVAGVRAPASEESRDRVLERAELAAVWRACDVLGWPFGPLVQLLVVTGQRIGEVGTMRWEHLNLERAEWRLPAESVKTKRAHVVPLSPLALEIIAGLPRLSDGYVFPARKVGSQNPVSGFSKTKLRLDALSGVTGWRYHDLRRTLATGMQRLGVRLEVTEAVLNHMSGSRAGIVGVYQRHEYGPEKRQALDAWAREVERTIGRGEAKVIALGATRLN
jgi:integrase